MKIPGAGVNKVQSLEKAKKPIQEVSKLDQAAKGMEKMFLKYLMDELRKSSNRTNLFGDKKKNDFFESELYNEYARLMVDRGDFGLAKMIKEHVKKFSIPGREK